MRLFLGTLLALGVVGGMWFTSTASLEAGGGGACHQPLTKGNVNEVAISENCFGPTVAYVAVGDKVTWTNHDAPQHNVYPPGQGWSEGHRLYKGNTTSATFDAAGAYPYVCSVHPGMVGVVVVGDGISAAAQPYQLKDSIGLAESVALSSTGNSSPEASSAVAAAKAPQTHPGDGGWTIIFAGLGAVASALGLAGVGLVAMRRR
jgi:plastocyanin